MRWILALLLLAPAGSAGCISWTLGNAAADHFQHDNGCAEAHTRELGGGDWEVSGCGETTTYTCVYGRTEDFAPKDAVCVQQGNLDTGTSALQTVVSGSGATVTVPTPPPAAEPHHFPLTSALATMALAASFAEDCSAVPGPRGSGSVETVFGGDGHVSSVTVSAPFAGTPVGECVASKFRRVVLRPFSGGPKKTKKMFMVPEALPLATAPAAPPASPGAK
jgi:hypothetical protein